MTLLICTDIDQCFHRRIAVLDLLPEVMLFPTDLYGLPETCVAFHLCIEDHEHYGDDLGDWG